MSNKSFSFKRFVVFHDKCAMKVGTDGVLLGAWANVKMSRKILDIGAGTGLISLMLSQRNENARITAIEIDEDASIQAKENVANSPFVNNIFVDHTSLQDFVNNTSLLFDTIVSNPPFFVNSLQSPDSKRTKARHTDELSLQDLLSCSREIITSDGALSLIYPYDVIGNIEQFVEDRGWYIHRCTNVFPKRDSPSPKRLLLELRLTMPDHSVMPERLIVERDRHVYSDEYIALTKDFYLKM